MGAAGRRRVWEEFNHERGAGRLVQLLASVNGSSGDYST
jgi:hypothetical protein